VDFWHEELCETLSEFSRLNIYNLYVQQITGSDNPTHHESTQLPRRTFSRQEPCWACASDWRGAWDDSRQRRERSFWIRISQSQSKSIHQLRHFLAARTVDFRSSCAEFDETCCRGGRKSARSVWSHFRQFHRLKFCNTTIWFNRVYKNHICLFLNHYQIKNGCKIMLWFYLYLIKSTYWLKHGF